MLHASFNKIVELSQKDVFTFEYEPLPEFLPSHGRLFVLIKISSEGDGTVTSLETARAIYAEIINLYYQQGDPFKQLGVAGKGVLAKYGKDLRFGIGAFVEDTLYLCAYGGLSVFLYRNKGYVQLLESKVADIVLASGHPVDGDIVLLGEPSFFEVFANKFQSIFTREGVSGGIAFFGSMVERKQYAITIVFKKEAEQVHIETPVAEEAKKITFSPYFGSLKAGIGKLGGLRRKSVDGVKVEQAFENIEDVKKRKNTLTIAAILLALLVVSIGFGVRQKKQKDYKTSYETVLFEAQHNFEEAEKLLVLNPARSRELFIQSKNLVAKLLSDGVVDERLLSLNDQLAQKEGKILGEYQAVESLYMDLKLIDENVEASDMASIDDQFVVLDKGGRRVVRIDYKDKNTKVIAGPAQVGSSSTQIAFYPPNAYLLDSQKIYSAGSEGVDIADFANGSLIYGYTGNIYVLKKSDSKIYRVAAISDGFASPVSWLANDQEPNFENVVSWSIDGAIWVLESGGDISKFTNGFEEQFNYSTPFALVKPVAIYTRDTLEYLYILDTTSKNIVVLDKEGVFIAQYKNDKLTDALDIVVSESEKIAIFLTKDKLYSIELSHLE